MRFRLQIDPAASRKRVAALGAISYCCSQLLPTMASLLFGIFGFIVVVGGIIGFFVWRGLQFKELVECGVATDAVIIDKRVVKPSPGRARQHKIAYRYTDNTGASHEHTSVVSGDVEGHVEVGQAFPIVYSAKRPQISAPKFLVDQAATALKKR